MTALRLRTTLLALPLAQTSAILGVNALLSGGFGFLFWSLAARTLPVAEVGHASAYTAALGLGVALAALGLPETLIRHLPHSPAPKRLVRAFASLSIVAGGIAGVLFLFVPASQAISLPFGLFAAIGITVASLLLGLANATLLSERRPGVIFIGSLLAGITKCTALLLALNAAGVIGAYGVGAVVGMAVAALIAYRNLPSGRENASEQPSMRRYAISNWISSIGSLLPPAIVPSLLLVRGGAELAAYGAMPLLLLSFLNLPASVVARSVFAEASRNPERLSALVRRGLLLAIAGSGLGFIGAALFGEVVLSLFGRGYAQEGAPLLTLLAAASFVAVPNYFIDTVLNVRRDAFGYAFVNIAGSIAVAGAVLLLAQDLPSLGIAWILGQATYLTIGLLVLVSRRRVRHG